MYLKLGNIYYFARRSQNKPSLLGGVNYSVCKKIVAVGFSFIVCKNDGKTGKHEYLIYLLKFFLPENFTD